MTAYEQGFMTKCAEYGIPAIVAGRMMKLGVGILTDDAANAYLEYAKRNGGIDPDKVRASVQESNNRRMMQSPETRARFQELRDQAKFQRQQSEFAKVRHRGERDLQLDRSRRARYEAASKSEADIWNSLPYQAKAEWRSMAKNFKSPQEEQAAYQNFLQQAQSNLLAGKYDQPPSQASTQSATAPTTQPAVAPATQPVPTASVNSSPATKPPATQPSQPASPKPPTAQPNTAVSATPQPAAVASQTGNNTPAQINPAGPGGWMTNSSVVNAKRNGQPAKQNAPQPTAPQPAPQPNSTAGTKPAPNVNPPQGWTGFTDRFGNRVNVQRGAAAEAARQMAEIDRIIANRNSAARNVVGTPTIRHTYGNPSSRITTVAKRGGDPRMGRFQRPLARGRRA